MFPAPLFSLARRRAVAMSSLLVLSGVLAACGGAVEEAAGETPPMLLVAEHPVTSEAALRAGVVDDGVDGDDLALGAAPPAPAAQPADVPAPEDGARPEEAAPEEEAPAPTPRQLPTTQPPAAEPADHASGEVAEEEATSAESGEDEPPGTAPLHPVSTPL